MNWGRGLCLGLLEELQIKMVNREKRDQNIGLLVD